MWCITKKPKKKTHPELGEDRKTVSLPLANVWKVISCKNVLHLIQTPKTFRDIQNEQSYSDTFITIIILWFIYFLDKDRVHTIKINDLTHFPAALDESTHNTDKAQFSICIHGVTDT